MLLSRRYSFAALAILGLSASFTACKQEYSPDEPLPYIPSESLYIGSQNQFVYAVAPTTGEKKWEFFTGGNIQGTPLLMDNKLYIPSESGGTNGNGVMYKVDADRGTQLFKFELHGQVLSSPIGKGNMVYVVDADSIHAFDINSNTQKWAAAHNAPQLQNLSSPILVGDKVVFGSYDGKVYAYNAATGYVGPNNDQPMWTFTPSGPGGPFYSSPVAINNVIYIGNADGYVYAINASDGTERWNYSTGNQVLSSPIVYGGNIIVGSYNGKLYCIDSASHLPRWVASTGDRIVSSPFATNQTVFVGSYDYYLYAFNIIDGTIRWKYRTDALIKSSPVVYKDKVYFASYDKFLYASDTAGHPVWKYNVNGLIETSPVIDNKTSTGIHASTSGASPN